jgi:hypothetical protein
MKMTFIAALLVAAGSTSFAAKTYQATGEVLEVTDSTVTVQKGKEKWEITRDASTKVDGDLKVGSKATVEYTMQAANVTVKAEKADKKKK